MSDEKKHVVFADSIGRVILGVMLKEEGDVLCVSNPAILNVVPNAQTGQIQVQLIPFFFKEFAKDTDKPVTWNFSKSTISRAENLVLDERLVAQYTNMYSVIKLPGSNIVTPQQAANTPVIKLFDE